VGAGFGASVIIGGELLRGSDSAEGDIGHAKTLMRPAAAAVRAAVSPRLRVGVRGSRLASAGRRAVYHACCCAAGTVGDLDAVQIVTAADRVLGRRAIGCHSGRSDLQQRRGRHQDQLRYRGVALTPCRRQVLLLGETTALT
jgi:hypothetical protein